MNQEMNQVDAFTKINTSHSFVSLVQTNTKPLLKVNQSFVFGCRQAIHLFIQAESVISKQIFVYCCHLMINISLCNPSENVLQTAISRSLLFLTSSSNDLVPPPTPK